MLCHFLGLDTPVWHCLCKDHSNHFFFKGKLKSLKLESTYFCDYQIWLELLLDFILQKKLIILVYTYLVYTSHECIKVKRFQCHFPSRDIEQISWLQCFSLMIFYCNWRSSHPSVLPLAHSLCWCLRCMLVLCTANPSVLQARLLETKCLMWVLSTVILTFYWFLLFSCLVCQLQILQLHLIHPSLLSHARVCHGYAAFDFLTRRMHIELSIIHCSYSSVCLSVFAPYLLVSFNSLISFVITEKTGE